MGPTSHPDLVTSYPLCLGKLFSLQVKISSSTKEIIYVKPLEYCQAKSNQAKNSLLMLSQINSNIGAINKGDQTRGKP